MRPIILLSALVFLGGAPLVAATINTNCTAQVQATGACSSANNGVAGILFGYWVSLTDAAPADPDVGSDAADMKDAICANFGIASGSCTAASADGAVRRYLESLVTAYRRNKKVVAVPAAATPAIDSQQNP
jgi:hypothetical protein